MPAKRTSRHGPPLLGEPVPLELANTIYARQGHLADGLRTAGDLAAWLSGVRSRLATPLTDAHLSAVDEAQLAQARDLRDAIRGLAQTGTDDDHEDHDEPPAGVLDRLNRHAAAGARWRELRWGKEPHTEVCSSAPPVTAALAELAGAAAERCAGPQRGDIRVCGAPGCVLYFLRDHPRRTWCSTACGNRVRAARHYERARAGRT
jgi:predicted RNA-binding Zn ribbon-like protein